QVADVRAQRVRVAAVGAPHVRVEPVRRHDVAGVGHQEIEDPEFRGREAAELRAPRDLVRLGVEEQPVRLDLWLASVLLYSLRSAQDRADAGDELPVLERLPEEVIGAEIEGASDVWPALATGEEQDRSLGFLADPTENLEAIEV